MNELIETYIRKRDELSALTKQYRAELDALEDQMRLKLHELGARSLKTEMGTVFTSQRRTLSLNDADTFLSWAAANDPTLIKKTLDTTEALAFLEANDGLPPGVGMSVTEVLSVRSAGK